MVYSESVTTFSPDGRLLQVEYAQNASENGGLVLFYVDNGLVHVFAERRPVAMQIERSKLTLIDGDTHFYLCFSGVVSDSYTIIDRARAICHEYRIRNSENIPVDVLASDLASFKQRFTIEGGRRPFGVRTLLIGDGRAFIVEINGCFGEYKVGAIGGKSSDALEAVYNEFGNSSGDEIRCAKIVASIFQNDYNKISYYMINKCKEAETRDVKELLVS